MNKKGVALILCLVVVVILMVLSAAMLSSNITEGFVAQRFARSSQAFWLAEAGIQRAHRTLNDNSWGTTGWNVAGLDSYSKTENLAIGTYSVTVNCISCSNPIATSTGTVNGVQRQVMVKFATESPFQFGIFSRGQLTMSGNGFTDSYDSSKGVYGNNNKSADGGIATDGTDAGIIGLSGNAKVNGDAGTGPGGTVVKTGNASVTGQEKHDVDMILPPVAIPSCLTDLSDAGAYSASGNETKTLPSGNYRYSSMSISGNGKINVTGTVKIYLTSSSALGISGNGKLNVTGGNLIIYTAGSMSISGNGIANNTNVPSNVIIKSTYQGVNGVSISGNGDLQGVIYAPNTNVSDTGNGSIFGAVIGKTVTISGNGNVHYDKALKNLTGGSFAIQNWTDENLPYPLSEEIEM
ncbi:MAG TPA: hypothetical protein VMD52_02395 [Patescibacteria group bacterium]|nr:hypothetical protein [Patescibacteria group bacterium]